jgi:hypothetical protein
MRQLSYIFSALLVLFAPIQGILIAVGAAIMLDTFTGVFKSIKTKGWSSIRSRRLSNIVSKMLLYEICVLFLFLIDKFVLNEFMGKWFEIDYMFTKICGILIVFIELTSIKENIEEAFNINIWKMLKEALLRAKDIRKDIDEIA